MWPIGQLEQEKGGHFLSSFSFAVLQSSSNCCISPRICLFQIPLWRILQNLAESCRILQNLEEFCRIPNSLQSYSFATLKSSLKCYMTYRICLNQQIEVILKVYFFNFLEVNVSFCLVFNSYFFRSHWQNYNLVCPWLRKKC